MSVTVWGPITKLRGLSETRDNMGRVECRSFDDLDLTIGTSVITADHNPRVPVGTIAYCEIDQDERVWVVGVVNDKVAQLDQPVYWSGEYVYRGPRDEMRHRHFIAPNAELTGVSLVLDPGSHEARALRMRDGDVRHGGDTAVWPGFWKNHDKLLHRAQEHNLSCRSARRIVDKRHHGYPPDLIPDSFGITTRRGRPVPPQAKPDHRPGQVEHSQHRGKVLAVHWDGESSD